MHALASSHAAALLALASAAPVVTLAAPVQQAIHGAIVFERMEQNADGTLRSSNLWLSSSTGVRPLTPLLDGVLDEAGTWADRGTRIAFEHGSATSDSIEFDIRIVDPANRQLRQVSSGPGNSRFPAWGPGERLAFVSSYRRRDCLSVIEVNGRRHLHLFCVPSPAAMARPVWSADGRNLYIHAGYYTGNLEPLWRSLVYRVDAATGASFMLFDQVLQEPRSLEFSPDGTRGIYSDTHTNEMDMVDFVNGQSTPVGNGYAPRWSKDGQRIAFSREVFEFDNPPDFRYYEALFVMDAKGFHARRVTRSRVDNHAYTAVQWSDDGVHLLANRRIFVDPSLTLARYSLRIIDVDTSGVTPVTDGYAEPGAWLELRPFANR
ncbi:MAG: acyl-peptide hydrolase [Xanthomonadaceae bacterium]|nr:acyl-peptide hydrolase [Xanthomonadaceae bacterium]